MFVPEFSGLFFSVDMSIWIIVYVDHIVIVTRSFANNETFFVKNLHDEGNWRTNNVFGNESY